MLIIKLYYVILRPTQVISDELSLKEDYKFNNNIIYNLDSSIIVENFESIFKSNIYRFEFKDNNNDPITSGKLYTGYKVSTNKGNEYTLSIKGDTLGKGLNNASALNIANHIIDDSTITKQENLYAADYNSDGDIKINDVVMLLKDINKRTHTLSLDLNGGTNVDSTTKKVIYRETYGELPTPTREGYTFMGWNLTSNYIPSEYGELEYIESTGTQYIDTDIKPSNELKMEILYTDVAAIGSNYVFGSRDGSSGTVYYGLGGKSSDLSIGSTFDGNSAYCTSLTRKANTKYLVSEVIEHSADKGYRMHTTLNNLTTGDEYTLDTAYSDNGLSGTLPNIHVFGYNSNNINQGMKLYSLKIWNQDALVRNFVPCYRKSDNEIGLYDTINGVFYSNNGDGKFEKSNDINNNISSSSIVTKNEDHTIYALWKKDE